MRDAAPHAATSAQAPLRAPIVVEVTRAIPADAETLWDLQSDPSTWLRWHPEVSMVSPCGPLHEGATFDWVWRGTHVRSRVERIVAHRHVAWRSESAVGSAREEWDLVPDESGCTLVRVVTSLDPRHILTRAPRRAQLLLDRALRGWLDGLARAVSGTGDTAERA